MDHSASRQDESPQSQTEASQTATEPTTTALGPFSGPAVTHLDGSSEHTPLLPGQKNTSSGNEAPGTHYRNIDSQRFQWLFGCIIFGNLIGYADSTLMSSSHPVITSYFNAANSASWLSTVFYLTSTIFQPLYGRISDTIGRRPVFLFSIFIFFLSTVWCALAQSIGSLIVARAVCGLGAGGVTSMAAVITSDVVKLEYRGIYQSYINLAYGFGNGMGAAFGGILCDSFGWRSAFGVQLPFIVILGILAAMVTPKGLGPCLAQSAGRSKFQALKTFDFAGAAILTVTVTGLILGINLGGNVLSWTHPLVLTALSIFAVAVVTLVFVERKAIHPMLPILLLTRRPTSILMWSNFLHTIITNTVLFYVPLYLQAVRQTSASSSGLFMVAPLVGLTFTSVFTGFFITWTRRMKPMMVAGTFCVILGTIGVTLLTPSLPEWIIPFLISGQSIGQGFHFPATTIAVLAVNPQNEQAVVTTTLFLLRNLGSIVGVAISSLILQNSLRFFLGKTVTGPSKDKIIRQVRSSIKAIGRLSPKHKSEAINAYAQALRLTFGTTILLAAVAFIMIVVTKIPFLQRQSDKDAAQQAVDEE